MRTPRLSALILTLALSLSACGRLVELQPTRTVALATAQQPDALRAAIVRALQAGGYALEREDAGHIIARQTVRGTSLRVALAYGPTQIQIDYLDSEGLHAAQDARTGRMMISARYERVMSALSSAIDEEIARPAREAQEAEQQRTQAIADAAERERQQQLALAQEQRMREQQQLDARAAEQESRRQAVLDRQETRRAAALERRRLREEARHPRLAQQQPVVAQQPVVIQQAPVVVQQQPVYAQQQPVYTQQQPVYAPQQAIYVQQQPVYAQQPQRAEATYGSPRLQTGFYPDPQRFSGRAYGRIPAERLGGGCAGWISEQPDYVLYLDSGFSYMRIDTASASDTTIVVRGPDGTFCDDDSAGGRDARVAGAPWLPGRYEIWVGTFERGAVADFQLEVSEQAPPAAVAAAEPTPPPAPAAPDCRQLLLAAGHHPSNLMYCEGAEPYCAEALLAAGHHPTNLIYCRDVDAACAVALLRAGNHPTTLGSCR